MIRLSQEARAIFALALPILGTQLAQTANGFVDTVMAGRVSATDLAAVALGSSFWVTVYLFMAGVLIATTPTIAHLLGQNQKEKIATQLHQAFWLAGILGCVTWFVLRHCEPVLLAVTKNPELSSVTAEYLKAVSWGMLPAAFYIVLRCMTEALNHVMPVFITSVIGLLLNIPANYVFIHGKLGLPTLGGVGCGWATSLVMWCMLFMMWIYVSKSHKYQDLGLLNQWPKPVTHLLLALLALGLPIGFSILFEVSVFTLIALFVAKFGTETVASHQVALNFSSLVFMFPLSIAMALTVRVGYAAGNHNPTQIHAIVKTGLAINMGLALCLACLMVTGRHWITTWYTPNPAVQALAASLLLWAALFQLSDAVQAAANGILRGYKDTKTPMIITLFSYWGLGLPIGYGFANGWFTATPWQAHGFWLGLVVGLSVAAVLLIVRMSRFARMEATV